jgi:hypothetical protein
MTRRLLLAFAAVATALTIGQWGLAAQAPAAQAPAPASRAQAPPQGRGQAPARPAAPPQTGQSTALGDLTGYWVSVVDQDWYFRMITPPKGQYAQVPLNAAARMVADQFDPALYGGTNYQTSGIIDCRAYGAAGLMHMPTRLHITWASANVLKIETDWGQQTRLINFTPGRLYGDIDQALRSGEVGTSHGPASMQGYSVAVWEQPYRVTASYFQRVPPAARGGGGGLGQSRINEAQSGGNLAVVTTDLTPGWLRRNGVPYGSRTRLIEHYRTFQDPTGADWIDVTSEVIDPEYLNTPFFTTADFRKEPDGSKWAPHPCKTVAAR